MAYLVNVGPVSHFIIPSSANELYASFGEHDGVGLILNWNELLIGSPIPTEQQINDAANDLTVVNGRTFSQWLAEHGGDPALTMHRKAKELLDATTDNHAAILRAVLLELLKHMNLRIAKNHNDLLTWLGTQTTLINRVALPGFQIPTPSVETARDNIKDIIAAGEADN